MSRFNCHPFLFDPLPYKGTAAMTEPLDLEAQMTKAVAEIVEDIGDRAVIKWEWSKIELPVMREIRRCWRRIILKHLDEIAIFAEVRRLRAENANLGEAFTSAKERADRWIDDVAKYKTENEKLRALLGKAEEVCEALGDVKRASSEWDKAMDDGGTMFNDNIESARIKVVVSSNKAEAALEQWRKARAEVAP